MKIIKYEDFLFEGKRADIISFLCDKYNNKEHAIDYITTIESNMMDLLNNRQLVNKYIYTVIMFLESNKNMNEVLKYLSNYVNWEPKMRSQSKQLSVDQMDNMTFDEFKYYLDDFYKSQESGKWKSKNTAQLDINPISGNYEIVHIPNWNVSKQYAGNKLDWCTVKHESSFLGNIDKGETIVYAFQNGYDNLKSYNDDYIRFNGEGDANDKFATSALGIKIHVDGNITVTTRYNHNEGLTDDAYGDNTINVLNKLGIYDSLLPIIDTYKNNTTRNAHETLEIAKHIDEIPLSDNVLNNLRIYINDTSRNLILDKIFNNVDYEDWQCDKSFIKLMFVCDMPYEYVNDCGNNIDWDFVIEYLAGNCEYLTPERILQIAENTEEYFSWEGFTSALFKNSMSVEYMYRLFGDNLDWDVITNNALESLFGIFDENDELHTYCLNQLNWEWVTTYLSEEDYDNETIQKYKNYIDWELFMDIAPDEKKDMYSKFI